MKILRKNPVIIISGPTASGKTTLSLNLSRYLKEKFEFENCIINFDSLLFYKELNIGTAKPSMEELTEIEHKLINIRSINQPINSFDFVSMAQDEISQAHKLGKVVLLVGGSAFYLRALFTNMYDSKKSTPEIKKQLDDLFSSQGIKPFLDILEKNDPESLKTLHSNDQYRIYRAVEYFLSTGKPISREKSKAEGLNPYILSPKGMEIYHCYLCPLKDLHLKIIEERTSKIINDGLIDEVKSILANGFRGDERPLKSIGYKEAISYLHGEIKSIDELKEKIFISTRQLAKSQKTFFNKISPKIQYDPITDFDKIYSDVEIFLRKQ